MVQTVRVPEIIDLSGHRIAVGDTTAFVTKINTTQQVFEQFSNDLGGTVTDLQLLAGEVQGYRDQAQAIVGFDGDYNGLSNLPDLTVLVPHTAGLLTDYREKTSTDLTNSVLDFAVGNVAIRTLTAPIAFTVSNVPATGSAKLELILTAGVHAVDWAGIAGLVWEGKGEPPVLNAMDRVVFSKYHGDTAVYATHSKVA
jgi:hypothetical protein